MEHIFRISILVSWTFPIRSAYLNINQHSSHKRNSFPQIENKPAALFQNSLFPWLHIPSLTIGSMEKPKIQQCPMQKELLCSLSHLYLYQNHDNRFAHISLDRSTFRQTLSYPGYTDLFTKTDISPIQDTTFPQHIPQSEEPTSDNLKRQHEIH